MRIYPHFPFSQYIYSINYLIAAIRAIILVNAVVQSLIAGIALIISIVNERVGAVASSPIELIISAETSPRALIYQLVAAIGAVPLVHIAVIALIPGVPQVMPCKMFKIPTIAIPVKILVILLGIKPGRRSSSAPRCIFERRCRNTRGRGECGQSHPWKQ